MYVEKRVKKTIKKQGKIPQKARIGVAVSGGKDSLVCLFLLHRIFSNRPDVDIIAISVDEGIRGYRDKSLDKVRHACTEWDISYHEVSFKEHIGWSMDEIQNVNKTALGACSYCGVFRRTCLNTIGKTLEVDRLATGHNLDDMAQSILMNFVNADMKKLARLGPHLHLQLGLIPRMMPLRWIPEKENAIYALLQGIDFYESRCPYSTEALRGTFKDMVYLLETRNPGTRHSILHSFDSIKESLRKQFPPADLKACKICNEPTTQCYCQTCNLKNKLENLFKEK
ncbi:MAG: TIGR00269 family protein [Candidatus Thermoplasmatota archaeon]|nr:TIGR00269 family protein [Candidatus Thermoplasmatota archaeon]